MTDYGSIEVIREILDIEEGTESQKLLRLKKLSNVWFNSFAPPDILDSLDTDTKDMAVNLHCVYLFLLSSAKFSGDIPEVAKEFKDEGTRLLEQVIRNENNTFEIYKVNN